MDSASELQLVCYISSASRAFLPGDLEEILLKSRQRNEARGISGVLLHCDGTFMQILEGPSGVVESLFKTISMDSRHTRIQRLLTRRLDERLFGDWSMACRAMSSKERRDMGLYAELLNPSEESESREYFEMLPPWIHRLVNEFRRINR